ncbi:MAG: molybdopterin molybdotransferase MoeA [Epsilonproteobacteria bacterium]|nr:molybdopterin molybdotransferase MoeA [Campylobacterota bacterium]
MSHISYQESIKRVDELDISSRIKRVYLEDSLGYVLAEDIIATYNNPPAPTASMDGYAIRYEDIDSTLDIIGANPAGSFTYDTIQPHQAVKTFTGSFMPYNADTLVPIENVDVVDNRLSIHTKVPRGFSVREIGEDFKDGEVIIKKGTKITFAEIGVMASLNIVFIKVYDKTKIAVLSTGSEILDLTMPPQEGKIYSSNNYTLSSLGRFLGFEMTNAGLIEDNKDAIKEQITSLLSVHDIVVTTGGVSVGDFDFVKEVVGEYEVIFHGVNIKPGQWVMVAKAANKYIISLPGFAYSSFVTFLLYVVRIANKMSHYPPLKTLKARLRHHYKKFNPKTQFVAVNLSFENGFVVDTFDKKTGSSAILTNLINNCALMQLPEGIYELDENTEVDVIVYNKDMFCI